jgi:hypothetical protein
MENKLCKKCENKRCKEKDTSQKGIKRRREYYDKNKKLIIEKISIYQKTSRGKEITKKSVDLWQKNNKEKTLAEGKVKHAVKTGLLIKPKECSVCKKAGRIEGHHYDYNKPLDVFWLCTSCHNHVHTNIRRSGL